MKINVNNWKPIQLKELFIIRPTKSYKNMSKEELDDGGQTPFVVNSAVNNGIGGYSSLDPTEEGGIITFSDTTNGDTFFYQRNNFIGFSHVQGMYPITREWNEHELIFLVSLLNFHNRGRYNYGRKMTRENILNTSLLMPATVNGEIDFNYMSTFIKKLRYKEIITKNKKQENINSVENWKEFYLHKLFNTSMGNGIDAIATTSDNPKYNYVSRDSNGNGVVGFVDEVEGQKPFPAGAMSLALGGSFLGSCFIQKEPFYTAQNVGILQEKEPLSIHTKLFISTLIRNECKIKYQAFGRELNSHFRKDFTLKLPVLMNGKGYVIDREKKYSECGYIPDWKRMENYIKSLPYGDRIDDFREDVSYEY